MTDKQTLKWWIDHARALEEENDRLRMQAKAREERIRTSVVERNTAYAERDLWKMKFEAYRADL